MPKGAQLCPCLSGRTFSDCCGRFAESPMRSGETSSQEAHASLRRHLLEMVRVSAGMQELWFSCIDNLSDPLRAAFDDPSNQQAFLDHFLWDWFKKYSEARPIVRVARFFEPTDLRLANHLDSWSLAPMEPWIVQGLGNGKWHLMQLGCHREVEALESFAPPDWKVGDALLTRILHHAGHDFVGLHTTRFQGSAGVHRLESHWNALAKKFGFAPQTRLRPDIHNEIWLSLHEELLGFAIGADPSTVEPKAAALPNGAMPMDEAVLDTPLPELAGQTPLAASKNELGQLRLRKWLDQQTLAGFDTEKVRKRLKV